MKKIILLFFIFSFNFISSIIAQPEITFNEIKHNFGEIAEGTIATHDFTFTNTGNAPLIISSVSASCGCTTPNWTKEPVMPGKKGVVTASYNSLNRPGAFNKSISVTSNGTTARTTLYIMGSAVKGDAVTKQYTKEELEVSPHIRLSKQNFSLGKIQKGHSVPVSLPVSNTGKNSLRINGIKSACNCVSLDPLSPKVISSGDATEVKIIYRPYTTGTKSEEVKIISNDLSKTEYVVLLQAEVVEDIQNQSVIKKEGNTLTF